MEDIRVVPLCGVAISSILLIIQAARHRWVPAHKDTPTREVASDDSEQPNIRQDGVQNAVQRASGLARLSSCIVLSALSAVTAVQELAGTTGSIHWWIRLSELMVYVSGNYLPPTWY